MRETKIVSFQNIAANIYLRLGAQNWQGARIGPSGKLLRL